MNKLFKKLPLLLCGGLLATAVTAQADIVVYSGIEGGNQGTDNILFNDTAQANGTTVNGWLNTDHNVLVNFTGNEILSTPASGQARVEATDGAFKVVTIQMADPSLAYNKLIFNIDAVADGNVTLAFTGQNGAVTTRTVAVSGSGQNFFTAMASNGDVIRSTTIDSSASLTSIGDLQQVRVGVTANPGSSTNPVPEPATMLLFGTGVVGLAGMARRKGK